MSILISTAIAVILGAAALVVLHLPEAGTRAVRVVRNDGRVVTLREDEL